MRRAFWLLILGCAAGPLLALDPPPDAARVEAAGLHNVIRVTPQLLTGSSPEGEEGFRSLQRLGVRTVITVDGAAPDVATAKRFGLRYVHLPIGYDGLTQEQGWRIARAVRDLPGPIYLHCHHGKHRAPAAAAVAHLCLDPACTVEAALAELQRAGTDPHYAGLYASLKEIRRPTPQELDRLPAEFPEVAQIPALAKIMVAIDERWENLRQARAAGWKAPAAHPDLDSPHEALQLAEHYREAARRPDFPDRPEPFRRWTAEAGQHARDLETALRGKPADPGRIEQAFRTAGADCTQCHARYRDVPRR